MKQATLHLTTNRVKRLAMGALRLGSVLVDIWESRIIYADKGKEQYSRLPWFRIRSDTWYVELKLLIDERLATQRRHGTALAQLQHEHEKQLLDLKRQHKLDELSLQRVQRDELRSRDSIIKEHLREAGSFYVLRDGTVRRAAGIPDNEDEEPDWLRADTADDDFPF